MCWHGHLLAHHRPKNARKSALEAPPIVATFWQMRESHVSQLRESSSFQPAPELLLSSPAVPFRISVLWYSAPSRPLHVMFGPQQTWHFTVLLCLPHVTIQLTASRITQSGRKNTSQHNITQLNPVPKPNPTEAGWSRLSLTEKWLNEPDSGMHFYEDKLSL